MRNIRRYAMRFTFVALVVTAGVFGLSLWKKLISVPAGPLTTNNVLPFFGLSNRLRSPRIAPTTLKPSKSPL